MRVLDAVRLGHEMARKLTIEENGKRPRSIEARMTAGSIVWRVADKPGVILTAYVERFSGKVFVAEEREWLTLPEAVEVLRDVGARYLPLSVFYPEGEESKRYLRHFRESLQQTLHFTASPYSGEGSFGVQVLEDLFDEGLLSVPRDGILAQQLAADWREKVKELPAVPALIHLAGGIRRYGRRHKAVGFANWTRRS